jgi:hypothetical protein
VYRISRSKCNTFVVNKILPTKLTHYMFQFTEGAILRCNIIGKGKGKAIPLQAWTGPEGSRRLRLPYFKKIGT